jgi:SET domain-containing protein
MLHKHIVLVEDEVIHGWGLRATALIRTGEVISRLEPDVPTHPIQEVLKLSPEEQETLLHYGYQYRDVIVMERAPEKYMNHSCDPNTWWADDETMVARRNIQPGEEITYDYSTTELAIPFEMQCRCNAPICRKRVTHLDYLLPEWQARFGDHLPSWTRAAITEAAVNRITAEK